VISLGNAYSQADSMEQLQVNKMFFHPQELFNQG
jgi:hypothetical protein